MRVSDLENSTDPDTERWQVLHPRPDWLGPGVDDVVRVAQWAGVEAARADYWTAPAAVTEPPAVTEDEAAPLQDADYWRLQLVPYLQETGADDAGYETWGVPAEYRPASG